MFKCDICSRSFSSKRSLTSHKNHHNPDYHSKSKAGALSSQYKASEASKSIANSQAIANKELYNTNPKCCKTCSQPLPYSKRSNTFCNASCSATFHSKGRIKSESSKDKLRKTPGITIKDTPSARTKKPYTLLQTCVHCNNVFKHDTKKKTCSKDCYSSYMSSTIKKSFEDGNHKGNKYRCRSEPSYMERSFKEWIDTNFPHVVYEEEKAFSIYLDGKYETTYFVDFYFPSLNVGIELDGSHHLQQVEYDLERDKRILEHHGISLMRISHKEYLDKSRIDDVTALLS